MPYDETLADRVRKALAKRKSVTEKKMFGGLAFMLRGHMSCGILKDELMLRVGADAAEAALKKPHTRPMDFTGKPMKGMLFVSSQGMKTDAALKKWVDLAVEFVATLPRK